MLVTADNFLQMFFGWEGVGVSSYLLINFWHTRLQANKAAIKAILFNRVGDMALFVAIGLIVFMFRTLNFSEIFSLVNTVDWAPFIFMGFNFYPIDMVSILLFIGAAGKSAQLGLHPWLPDAMEGPTPVSALIHAATMVTAGVFVLIRSSPILEYSPFALSVINFVGALTAFFAATTAAFQNDLKRIIAYSTCSQLGYMVSACGMSAYNLAFFHLVNHAFFKALLFLGAGAIIHALDDEQDIRRMGGLAQIYPLFYVVMMIGSFSLMGFPFLTGFYSKERIMLFQLASASNSVEVFSGYLLIASALFTAFYSIRLVWFVFLREYGGYRANVKYIHAHPHSLFLIIPLFVLAICSIFMGYLGQDLFIGSGTRVWNDMVIRDVTDVEFYPTYFKLAPMICSIIGAVFAYFFYSRQRDLWKIDFISTRFVSVYSFFNNKWHFDVLYEAFFITPFLKFNTKRISIEMNSGFLERISTQLSGFFLRRVKDIFDITHDGNITRFIFFATVGLVLVIVSSYLRVIHFVYISTELIDFILMILGIISIYPAGTAFDRIKASNERKLVEENKKNK
jgi:proton-translocating NADH-quinone oxidoreductase chain L